MTTPTPSPVLSAELEKDFNEKFYVRHDEHCTSQLDGNDCDCGEIDEKRRLKQFIAHAVSEAEDNAAILVVRNLEKWDLEFTKSKFVGTFGEFVKKKLRELLSERKESYE